MSAPYRSGPEAQPEAERADDGLVDDLVRQFADPLAFYRELVQNGIDAGATRLVITLAHESSPRGVLHVSVRDDGCGMGQRVLEEELTVLFRSGKEKRDDTIGKFGVGFVSVLAVEPELVAIRTRVAGAEELILHLHPDRTYDLFRGAAASEGHGTTVTLHVPMAAEAVANFAGASQAALTRWCRHAGIPIHFVASVGGEAVAEARIDRPHGFPGALVEVRVERAGTLVVAALPKEPHGSLAFYNRGLLLHETREGALGPLWIAIQDDRLEHTLSRDDVRRDAHLERALRVAREVVDHQLTAAVETRLAAPDAAFPEVLKAALAAQLPIDRDAVRPPRVCGPASREPGARSYLASARDALVEAAVADGAEVLDLSIAKDPEAYALSLAELRGGEIEMVHDTLTVATPVEPSGADLLLIEALHRLLGTLAREPELHLVTLEGALAGQSSVTGRAGARLPGVIRVEEGTRDPFARFRRPPLWLDANAPLVAAARRAAERDPELAAALLARVLLLRWRALDAEDDDAWLEAARERRLEQGA